MNFSVNNYNPGSCLDFLMYFLQRSTKLVERWYFIVFKQIMILNPE